MLVIIWQPGTNVRRPGAKTFLSSLKHYDEQKKNNIKNLAVRLKYKNIFFEKRGIKHIWDS